MKTIYQYDYIFVLFVHPFCTKFDRSFFRQIYVHLMIQIFSIPDIFCTVYTIINEDVCKSQRQFEFWWLFIYKRLHQIHQCNNKFLRSQNNSFSKMRIIWDQKKIIFSTTGKWLEYYILLLQNLMKALAAEKLSLLLTNIY